MTPTDLPPAAAGQSSDSAVVTSAAPPTPQLAAHCSLARSVTILRYYYRYTAATMTGDVDTETPVITDTEKTDKELIAEEEMAAEAEQEAEKEVTEEKPKKAKKEKKPTVFKKDWEEGKVYLFQSNRTPRIPSISPQELKIESFLKLHGVPYENVAHNLNLTLRKVKMPFIELNGETIAEGDILRRVTEKFDKSVTAGLTAEQVNVQHAMVQMVEHHLYWAVMDWRTGDVDNTLRGYDLSLPAYLETKLPPALLSLHYRMNVCKKVQKKIKAMGFHELEGQAKRDLAVLAETLGDKDFMFGSEPSVLDLAVFSVLAQLTTLAEKVVVEEEVKEEVKEEATDEKVEKTDDNEEGKGEKKEEEEEKKEVEEKEEEKPKKVESVGVSCPLREHLVAEHPNLVALVGRLQARCWGDHWDLATGDTRDRNPHIPKPEPVVEAEETGEGKEETKEDDNKDEEKKDGEEKKDVEKKE